MGTKVVYLPCETHTWLRTNNELFIKPKLQGVLGTYGGTEFDLTLFPLHMNEKHWGLIVIDLPGRKLFFDNGFKLQSGTNILPSIKYIWRFGMPSQHNCSMTGQGHRSCGVGVILSARDFIFKGVSGTVNQFGWDYTEMRHLRKQVMIQIIKWASE